VSASVVTRVQQLIRLATNAGASENEARNAALSAVKLIDEHKLLEQAPNGAATGFAAFMSNLPIDGIMKNLNVVALGASAMEIATMKDAIARLTHQNELLRKELAEERNARLDRRVETARPRVRRR
jgi:Protein of unknown function (DUF2786)